MGRTKVIPLIISGALAGVACIKASISNARKKRQKNDLMRYIDIIRFMNNCEDEVIALIDECEKPLKTSVQNYIERIDCLIEYAQYVETKVRLHQMIVKLDDEIVEKILDYSNTIIVKCEDLREQMLSKV